MEIPENASWAEVLGFLKARVQPHERLLAPDHFLNEFDQVFPLQIRRHWLRGEAFDWYVLHIEGLGRLDRAIVKEMLAAAAPVFANRVFFIFTRRPDVPRHALQDPAFQELQAFFLSSGMIGPLPTPPVKRGAVITTYNRSALLARTAPAVAATGAALLVVDDGSAPEHAAANRAIAERAGGAYLGLPANRGLPTALNCGVGYFLGDETITWISTFNDDVAIAPTLYQVLGKLEASKQFPLMTGFLPPTHKVLGTRTIDGVEVRLLRALSGVHMHGARDYWRFVLPIPTPYPGAPKPEGGLFPRHGADEDWWVGSYSPHAVAKAGGFIAAVPLIGHLGADASTWAAPA